MPTYQYACTECDHRFEAVQAFTDDSLTVCPVCGGQLRKVYGSVGVVFKGSGFYRTDSRAAGTSTAPANGSAEKSASGEKSGDKSGSGEKSGDKKGGEKKAAASSGDSGGSSSSGSKSSGSTSSSSSPSKAAS
ncbi:MAG: FmdB family zinc ribbon protein [Nakamurella sp.]